MFSSFPQTFHKILIIYWYIVLNNGFLHQNETLDSPLASVKDVHGRNSKLRKVGSKSPLLWLTLNLQSLWHGATFSE